MAATAIGKLALRPAATLEPVGDVFEHSHVRKQRVVLEQQPDVALVGALSVHGFAGDLDRAPIQILETGNQSKCRGLAAAARPERGAVTIVRFPGSGHPPLFTAFSGDGQRLGEIGDEVIGMLDADRQPYCRLKYSDPFPNVLRHTRMGHGGRMASQRFRAAKANGKL